MSESQSPVEVEIAGFAEKAFLARPSGPANGSGVLFLHWFDEAPNANRTQFLAEAAELAERGAVSLLPQLMFPWTSPPESATADIEQLEAERLALLAAVEHLQTREEVDPGRIAIVGHDFGAMHGVLLAAEINPACVVMIAPTPRWADWFLRFWPIEGDRFDYMRSLAPFDPITAVKGVSSPVLFQFGRHDFYISAMAGTELFGAANEPKLMTPYDTDHSMEVPEAKTERLAFLTEHLGI
ncbi:MAG: dienelactone hydrolase family protein [Acidimicrobiia bacterium]